MTVTWLIISIQKNQGKVEDNVVQKSLLQSPSTFRMERKILPYSLRYHYSKTQEINTQGRDDRETAWISWNNLATSTILGVSQCHMIILHCINTVTPIMNTGLLTVILHLVFHDRT